MTTSNKRFLGIFFGTILVFMLVGAGLAWAVHRAGMLEVDVHAKGPGGSSVTGIRVPAALGHLALALAPCGAMHCSTGEMHKWCPLAREACKQLSRCPDFTLVEVFSPEERVKIHKQGRSLIIDVDTDSERVHVAMPLGIAKAFVKKLERMESGRL